MTYVLMEIRQETDYVTHHIQKVAAFFAAMRAFAGRLRDLGHRVVYLKLGRPAKIVRRLQATSRKLMKREKFTRFEYLLPDEYRLDLQLRKLAEILAVPVAGCRHGSIF